MLSLFYYLKFKVLADEQWSYVEHLLQPTATDGKLKVDSRMTLNTILFVL